MAKAKMLEFDGLPLPAGFVPPMAASVKSRLSRAKRYPTKPTMKPFKMVYFRRDAYNLMAAAKKEAEAVDPRRKLYNYEFLSERVWEDAPSWVRSTVPGASRPRGRRARR
jgi:hypothetical protein